LLYDNIWYKKIIVMEKVIEKVIEKHPGQNSPDALSESYMNI